MNTTDSVLRELVAFKEATEFMLAGRPDELRSIRRHAEGLTAAGEATTEPAFWLDEDHGAPTVVSNQRKQTGCGMYGPFDDHTVPLYRQPVTATAPAAMVLVPKLPKGWKVEQMTAPADRLLVTSATGASVIVGPTTWKQSITGHVLYELVQSLAAAPAPGGMVPEPKPTAFGMDGFISRAAWREKHAEHAGWNACREAMLAAAPATQVAAPFAWYRPRHGAEADQEPEFRTTTPPDGHGWIPVPGAAAPAVVVDEVLTELAKATAVVTDAAQPVVWQTRLADHHGWSNCTAEQFTEHRKYGFQVRALYTADDYDALLAMVVRLQRDAAGWRVLYEFTAALKQGE
jgi:hypothetical protein